MSENQAESIVEFLASMADRGAGFVSCKQCNNFGVVATSAEMLKEHIFIHMWYNHKNVLKANCTGMELHSIRRLYIDNPRCK